jgi:hypothetical protein
MLEFFLQAVKNCYVTDLMFDPGLLDKDLLTWVDRFVSSAQHDIIHLFDHLKMEPMYISISRFINVVNEYNEYLKKNTKLSQGMLSFRVPLHRFDGDNIAWQVAFKKATAHYRQQIKSLYDDIVGSEIN